ncbi:MAG: glycerol-3-phosphate 1-O-acyltransferase PlsY [Cyanobacteria bacterium J06638_22]
MNAGVAWGIVVVAAYLLGSTPTGYWAGKVLKGIDIREHGSRSTGATNVLRTLGKGPALFVFLVDVAKGVVAIALARWLFSQLGLEAQLPWAVTAAALIAILGHSKSIWLGFKGGKSAATGLGVLFAVALPVGLTAAATFLSVLAIFRIVSLGSIATAIAAPLLMLAFRQPLAYFLFALIGGTYVLITHRANIQRLLAGQEPRIGQKHAEPQQETP